jgi:hypothetical protein
MRYDTSIKDNIRSPVKLKHADQFPNNCMEQTVAHNELANPAAPKLRGSTAEVHVPSCVHNAACKTLTALPWQLL